MLSRLIDGFVCSYLERARLEAGLPDGDKTLPGEEYGEREEPTVCSCPEDDKELLRLSGGVLGDKKREGRSWSSSVSDSDGEDIHYKKHQGIWSTGGVFSNTFI